ncbi:transcription termination/antitermination protein NusA [Deinococcus grandis]|uniref:Transcription termination/antitermination protein NusA n=2 Tax=Deinococcus grandis TaxID=57498 RepID=A0A124BR48_9DEIO|nr:hypothetical protein DEGR_31710 [Deinococcus grandis]GAQ20085.1 transcription termination/antitermination protein NusA [Deinococcus grandis]
MTMGLNPNSCVAKNYCQAETRMSIEAISSKMGISVSDWEKSPDGAYLKYNKDFNDDLNMQVHVSSISGNKLIFMGQSQEGYQRQH